MARRRLADSTLQRLRAKLEDERSRLSGMIAELEGEWQGVRLAETASEHNADPDNADGGSLAFEMEMDFSKQRNAQELLTKVEKALDRMDRSAYGMCQVSGKPIPLARLEALPYATTLVEWADRA
ncbi:MAG: TraR/DksA family transcriptional regulator [Acidimicrobiia bacterium]